MESEWNAERFLLWLSAGGESLQGEELPNHERPWENAERAGLSGEFKDTSTTKGF